MVNEKQSADNKIVRLPEWLKTSLPKEENYFRLRALVEKSRLNTVCESASCPNIGQCWDAGTLTLMILGDSCSRACRFCDVPTGGLTPPSPDEPESVAGILSQLNLRYAVITSVDRDDLADGGADHWAKTLNAIRERCDGLKVEALIPDFRGNQKNLKTVCDARPDVLAHNIETVESLQSWARPQSKYSWSLNALETAAGSFGLITKSGLMLGLGEKKTEVLQTMKDLLSVGCNILSLGQYLRPSRKHMRVVEFISPAMFADYKTIGEAMGFDHVEAGPLVRSSFRADRQARSAGILVE